jgi:hypothetical protein
MAQAQAILQMASQAPQLYDLRAAHRRVLKQMKVPAINEILPDPDGIKESNPALENVAMSMGRPAAAYPDQDHISHIKIHLMYAADPNYGGSPLIGPQFAPQALEHIKQHLTLHYLQSMRAYVAEAAGGEDTLKLHEENPMDIESQQALALAAQMVNEDAQATFQSAQPAIQALLQKVQQAQQSAREQAMNSDPTAQVIMKTQMAETERKAKESETKMQMEMQKHQQEYQLKVAQLEQKVQELMAKYNTQVSIDEQANATEIALANINNASRERVAQINAVGQLTQQQQQLDNQTNKGWSSMSTKRQHEGFQQPGHGAPWATATATGTATAMATARLTPRMWLLWLPQMQRLKHPWMLERLSTQTWCRCLDWTM